MVIREMKQKKAEIDSSSPHQHSTGSTLTPSFPSGYPATSVSYAITAVCTIIRLRSVRGVRIRIGRMYNF